MANIDTFTFEAPSLAELCMALSEGGHDLGSEITRAAYSIIMWAGKDCPWFFPGPNAMGIEVHPFISIAEEGF